MGLEEEKFLDAHQSKSIVGKKTKHTHRKVLIKKGAIIRGENTFSKELTKHTWVLIETKMKVNSFNQMACPCYVIEPDDDELAIMKNLSCAVEDIKDMNGDEIIYSGPTSDKTNDKENY